MNNWTTKKRVLISGIITVLFMILLAIIYHSAATRIGLLLKRAEIATVIYVFAMLHCFLDIEKMYDFLFRHRWLVFISIFVFLVVNCINFSSVGMFDNWIQQGVGSDFIDTIFGEPRNIRSDEWKVDVPREMSASYIGYGAINSIVRAASASGVSASGLQIDYALLRNPSSWGYYLFGEAYGLSFLSSYKMVFGFAFWMELFLIFTKKDRLISFFGACLIWMSSFNLWWSLSIHLLTLASSAVLFYYFLNADKRWKRMLFGMMLAISGANFACDLYPAWQVPMGWILLAIMLWMFLDTKGERKKFDAIDYLILVINVLFMVSIIVRFIYIDIDYIQAVNQTIYPGQRVEYGGMTITKLFSYMYTFFATVFEQNNPCEMGGMFFVFPLGYILLGYSLFKKRNLKLLGCLLIPLVLLTLYCTVGLPTIIAKITMMTSSTALRCVDILGVLLGIIMIIVISDIRKEDDLSIASSLIIAIVTVVPSLVYCLLSGNEAPRKLMVILAVLACVLLAGILCGKHGSENKRIQKYSLISMSLCIGGNGLLVHPLMKGVDVITSKPVYSAIREIVEEDPDAKWIAIDTIVAQQYLIACGAPTLNSVNYIPNLEMWEIMDPENQYEEIWNRYAHICVKLSDANESEYVLDYPDQFTMNLTVDDFEKLNVRYVFAGYEITDPVWMDRLTIIYNEYGSYIYQFIPETQE